MQKTLLLLSLICFTGCAGYEYDITRPTVLAAHIATKTNTTFARDPFEYRMQAVENRLLIEVENKTDDMIRLLGDQSSVVDPTGQSHPLRSQSIAPQSFIKMVFPPFRPTVQRTGPTFGIGVGTRIGDRRRVHDDDFVDTDDSGTEPRYLTVIDDSALYWEWPGEGQVRLLLAFDRKGKVFTHEFVIARVKVN